MKLPARRELRRIKERWPDKKAGINVYVDVGFDPGTRRPLEIFMVAAKTGSMLHTVCHDLAEYMSMMLQHGYSIADLQQRSRPGSLSAFALALAEEMTATYIAERPAR